MDGMSNSYTKGRFMNRKLLSWACLSLGLLVLGATPVLAADTTQSGTAFYGNAIAAGLGVGITLVGAGIGFGRIGASALESMARQPEVAAQVGTNMLIIAALLEGATFFSLIVCIIMAFKS
jgi:F-type H+-transporting ATPase subunit c